jgi:hypothetical protein
MNIVLYYALVDLIAEDRYGYSTLFTFWAYSACIWNYLTGILIIIKSFFLFKAGERKIGAVVFLSGLLFSIIGHFVIGYFGGNLIG